MKYIKHYDGVFDKEFCDDMIARFEKAKSEMDIVDDHRYFRVINTVLDESFADTTNVLLDGFMSTIKSYVNDCGINNYQWCEHFNFEQFRMKKYDAGYGRFSPHVDVNNNDDNKRFLVFFLYLNDVEEGGETTFVDHGVSIKPKQGSVLIFPPTWTYPHAGEVPLSNDKYIVGGYLHYGDM